MPDEQAPPGGFDDLGLLWPVAGGDPEPPPGASPSPPGASPSPAGGSAGGVAGSPGPGTPPPPPDPAVWQLPFPAPSQPSRRVAWLVGSAAVLAAALIAGSAGYVVGSQHGRISAAVQNLKAVAAGPCPSRPAPPSPSAISPAAAGLTAELLPMPSGASKIKIKQGALSLDDYVTEVYPGNNVEKQRIAARCFEAAASRSWLTSGGDFVTVWLIQFGTASGARSYMLSTEQGDLAIKGNTDKFTVTGVTDGLGIAKSSLDKYGNTLTRLLGDRGNVAMIIHIFVPARVDKPGGIHLLRWQDAELR